MNYRFVINQLGLLLVVLSAVLIGVTLWVLADWMMGHTAELVATESLLLSAGLGLTIGGTMWWFGRRARNDNFGRREALLLVTTSWVFGAALAALPFWLWAVMTIPADTPHVFHHYIDCYFESMSGLTTCGATVLDDIESLPRGLLLWRCLTHWFGGLGIVVLFVAVLPMVGVGGKRLVAVEAPVHSRSTMRPRINETARVLYGIYLALTVAQIVALRVCGMGWFDSTCHTFATIATGGFANKNASIGYYHSPAVDTVTTIFMIIGGANFGLYYLLLRRQFDRVAANTELRVYLAVMLIAVGLVTYSIYGTSIETTTHDHVSGFWQSLRFASFNLISLQTDCGFATADFDQWPDLAKATIFTVTIIGGCFGSTAGGIKVMRFWIVLRVMWSHVVRTFRPDVIQPIRTSDGVMGQDAQTDALAYTVAFLMTLFLGAAALQLLEQGHGVQMDTSITASIATLCTAGPGLGKVGPTVNYGWFTPASKLVMCLLMILGRLEIFTLLALFNKRFWLRD
ncbi:MAG: TrkH family potassium uptake protein [Phycisphaera sp.]|nr:TrkH family potassium uptake protein [Phycisphaera sp.]